MRSFVYRLLILVALLAMLFPSLSLPQGQAQARPASAVAIVADVEAPSPIITLSASTGASPGTVDLSWIAPGDDGTTGTASVYVVRYNTTPITEANWAASTDVSGEPTPDPASSVEEMTVTGLSPQSGVPLRHQTQDEVPNTSSISNSLRAMAQSSPNATYLPLTFSGARTVTPVIPDTTEVLLPETTQYLSSIAGDGAMYTFTQSTLGLEALEPGDIMVSAVASNAPYGFLRKVISVSSSGGQVSVATADATLEEAVESGEIQISQTDFRVVGCEPHGFDGDNDAIGCES